MTGSTGVVYLVGAGPGDPGLLTCRGLECLRRAEVLVYDGLVAHELLSFVPSNCETIYAGKKRSLQGNPLSQEEINALLVEKATAGKIVVRLKGGDPFVFGRGTEECLALSLAGLRFEVVSGVSAATAVGAYAGIPLTARGVSVSAVLVTGHEASGKSQSDVDWSAVAGNQTVVLFMAWRKIASCVQALIAAGCSEKTPAAAIRWGTTAAQQTLVTTLAQLPDAIARQNMKPPVLVIIGHVVELREKLAWFESRPLFGRRVLITRSRDRAKEFAAALRDRGAETVIGATTRIVPVDKDGQDRLVTALQNLTDYDWVFFTSANAVSVVFSMLREQGWDTRRFAGLKVAAVGPATERSLIANGLRPDLVASGKNGAWLARDLVDEIATDDKEPSGTRIFFPQARNGRDEPIAILRGAGYHVDALPTYSTEQADASELLLSTALASLQSGDIHVAAFFSPSQVDALFALAPNALAELSRVPVIAAIGTTTAAALEKRGVKVQAIASLPTSKELVLAIVDAAIDPD